MNSLVSYLKNVRAELTHVVWPSSKTGIVHTLIIIAVSALAAVFIGALDYVFTQAVSAIVNV